MAANAYKRAVEEMEGSVARTIVGLVCSARLIAESRLDVLN